MESGHRHGAKTQSSSTSTVVAHCRCGPSKIKMVFIFLVWTIFRILINRICRLNVSIVIWKAVRLLFFVFVLFSISYSRLSLSSFSFHPFRTFLLSSFSLNSTYVRNPCVCVCLWRTMKYQRKEMHSWKCTDKTKNLTNERTTLTPLARSHFYKDKLPSCVAQSWCYRHSSLVKLFFSFRLATIEEDVDGNSNGKQREKNHIAMIILHFSDPVGM